MSEPFRDVPMQRTGTAAHKAVCEVASAPAQKPSCAPSSGEAAPSNGSEMDALSPIPARDPLYPPSVFQGNSRDSASVIDTNVVRDGGKHILDGTGGSALGTAYTQRQAVGSAQSYYLVPPPPTLPVTLTPGSNRPIILPGGNVSITECANDVFQRIRPTHTIFHRGGATVEVIEDKDEVSTLSIVTPSAFRSRLEKYGQLFAWRSGENRKPVLKPTPCPEESAKALLDTEEARVHLPQISTITRCPVIIAGSGGIEILSKGYHDRNGGILITAGTETCEVGLCDAVDALTVLLSEFDFASEGDRARAIASLITPALKMGGWINGYVPADVAEADQSQSGKTFRQRLNGAIYNERLVIIALRRGGVGSVDESLSQKLIEGRPFLQLDNFRGKLDSPFLEAFLTADSEISARVPHRCEVRIDPSKYFVFLSSNGVESTRDFANRSSIIRIRKRTGFTFRRYPEGDLIDHVRARQSYYLGAVFAVIREWERSGRPRTGELRHDFKEWAQIADWIVQTLFGAAPLMDGHQTAQQRVSDVNLTFLRNISLTLQQRGRLGRRLTASDLSEICDEEEIEIPGLKTSAQQRPELRIGTVMRKAFQDCRNNDDGSSSISLEGFMVTRTECDQTRGDGGGTYTAKAYSFTVEGVERPHSAQAAQAV